MSICLFFSFSFPFFSFFSLVWFVNLFVCFLFPLPLTMLCIGLPSLFLSFHYITLPQRRGN